MAHLSPTTLTTDEQRLILRATAGNIRDHIIYSLALGTGLRLAEIVGLDVGDVKRPTHRRRGVPSHRFDPLNKCGLLLLPRERLPGSRWSSSACPRVAEDHGLALELADSTECDDLFAGFHGGLTAPLDQSKPVAQSGRRNLEFPRQLGQRRRSRSDPINRRPSDFLLNSPIPTHLPCPYPRAERCPVETGVRPVARTTSRLMTSSVHAMATCSVTLRAELRLSEAFHRSRTACRLGVQRGHAVRTRGQRGRTLFERSS